MTRQMWNIVAFALITLFVMGMVDSSLAQTNPPSPRNAPAKNTSMPMPAMDQMTNIPYFTLRDGMSSTLTLQNLAPSKTTVIVTIFNTKGKAQMLAPITIDPHSFKDINLQDVVVSQEFDSGNIEVAFSGVDMIVTCQVSIFSVDKRVSVESREQDMMDFMSSNLNGIVWLPESKAKGYLAVTNVGMSDVKVQLAVNSKKKELAISPRETELVELDEELGPQRPLSALVQLQHNGKLGDIITTGYVLDLDDGYSSAFMMLDSSIMRSSTLAGANFRFGQPDPSEGFPKGTQFSAPLLLANVGPKPTAAHVSVDYTVQEKSDSSDVADVKAATAQDKPKDKFSVVAVKDLTLAAGEVQRIDLAEELARLGVNGPVEDAGVDISYDGAPGTVIGQLTSLDQSGDYAFEVPIKDPSAMNEMIESVYPWTLEDGAKTVLHLKNTTKNNVVGLVTFSYTGGMYNPAQIDLKPYQTVAVDIQKLKDSKTKDVRGQVFPAGATRGQIVWRQESPYSMIGRAEQTYVKAGIARSFSCGGNLACCSNYIDWDDLSPSSISDVMGGSDLLTGQKSGYDCNGNSFGPNAESANSWTIYSGSGVATVSSGTVTDVEPGTAVVDADFTDYTYDYTEENSCSRDLIYADIFATVTVACPSAVNTVIAEYSTSSAYQPTAFVPQCSDFTSSGGSAHYLFSSYNQDDTGMSYSGWAILRSSLYTGVEDTASSYGSVQTMTSGYRSPLVNYNLETSLGITHHPNEQHLHGDAADLDDGHSSTVWNALDYIGKHALSPIACVEPHDTTYTHYHMDFRGTCPTNW